MEVDTKDYSISIYLKGTFDNYKQNYPQIAQ